MKCSFDNCPESKPSDKQRRPFTPDLAVDRPISWKQKSYVRFRLIILIRHAVRCRKSCKDVATVAGTVNQYFKITASI